MIFGKNATRDISKLSQISLDNFEISLVLFMPNITTNHAITYTNKNLFPRDEGKMVYIRERVWVIHPRR